MDDLSGSRVVGLWDQQAPGTPPAGYTYGDLYDTATLAAGTCPHAGGTAHGTHVAGIAAGRDAGSGFGGVAPGADLAFVQLGTSPLSTDPWVSGTTAICDGAAWIFELAASRGQAAVINMSLGMHQGPHDGTSLASQCLDNISGSGKLLVAAACNEGEGSVHGSGEAVHLHASIDATATPADFEQLTNTAAAGYTPILLYFDAAVDAHRSAWA